MLKNYINLFGILISIIIQVWFFSTIQVGFHDLSYCSNKSKKLKRIYSIWQFFYISESPIWNSFISHKKKPILSSVWLLSHSTAALCSSRACFTTQITTSVSFPDYYPGMHKNMVYHVTVHLPFPYSASNKNLENP